VAVNISESIVKERIEKWVNAWNGHDLKTVLSMYSDDIEFSSPKIKALFPERKISKVTNKQELEQYWTKALKNYPISTSYQSRQFHKETSVFLNILLY
jgi:ketosteroid isomerase-like protein